MKVLIPVAGFGKRLRPLTYAIPKALIEVAGKPVIAHIADRLEKYDVDQYLLVVSYKGEEVVHFLSQYSRKTVIAIQQDKQMGLGHAVWLAREHFEKEEPILIVLGDTIFDGELMENLEKGLDFLAVDEGDDPSRFGIVETNNKGEIIDLVEKPESPRSNLALVGVYFLSNSKILFDSLDEIIKKGVKTKGEFQLTDALSLLLRKGWAPVMLKVKGWYDCGKIESLLASNRSLLRKPESKGEVINSTLVSPFYIGEGVKIIDSIVGPHVSISDNVVVKGSRVKDAIIHEGSQIEESFLEHSVIGRYSKIRKARGKIIVGDSCLLEA